MPLFKAFIRVVKSIGEGNTLYFGRGEDIVRVGSVSV